MLPILILIFLASTNAAQNTQTFCQEDKCLTCIGRYCTTTCEGQNCRMCPVGDCCNGTNCNICRGEKCCSTEVCNSCVNNCLRSCQGVPTCHYDCFQTCLPSTPDNKPPTNYEPRLISNKNYIPVNVTTIINITNTIRNENFVNNTVLVNTTNVNNYTNQQNYQRKNVLISHYDPQTVKVPARLDSPRQNCCEVVHPEKCQKFLNQTELLCQINKHTECSSLCIGRHVHIIENQAQEEQCVAVATTPFRYCGNYTIENCDGCYCKNRDDAECNQSPECFRGCLNAVMPEKFYNKLYWRSYLI